MIQELVSKATDRSAPNTNEVQGIQKFVGLFNEYMGTASLATAASGRFL